jgi:magnesium-protoporphyrin O-methyltransferase
LARRGANVVAVDLSSSLIGIARDRMPADLVRGTIDFRGGDMLDPGHGPVDYVLAIDSLIHYETRDTIAAIVGLSRLTSRAMLITAAPRTPALTVMHTIGRVFPRGNRAPAIVPADIAALCRQIEAKPELAVWRVRRTERVISGFYMSHAIELVRR